MTRDTSRTRALSEPSNGPAVPCLVSKEGRAEGGLALMGSPFILRSPTQWNQTGPPYRQAPSSSQTSVDKPCRTCPADLALLSEQVLSSF